MTAHLARIALLAALAGCGTSTRRAHTPPPPMPVASPRTVDMACVDRAARGELLRDLPATVAGFRVTPAADGVHLHRGGHSLSAGAARTLWTELEHQMFSTGGLSTGDAGVNSTYRCAGVGRNGCFKLSQWVCQRSLEDVAQSFAAIAAAAGDDDTAVSIDIHFEETRGPACKNPAGCGPTGHYSRHDVYDPNKPRLPVGRAAGACHADGDCVGHQVCEAWYLLGGGEVMDYEMKSQPTFCGCVENQCTWFEQHQ